MLQRTNSLNAVNRIVTTTLNNAGRIANEIKDTKIDVEEQSLKQNQIKGDQSGVYSSKVKKSLPQNRQIIKEILDETKLSAKSKLIKSAISQFIDSRISNIKFFNKQFRNKDFNNAFGEELNDIFSSAFKETDLKDDSLKWADFFNSNLKIINTTPSNPKDNDQDKEINKENNQNFEHNLKILILAKKLSQIAKESNNNRFYYFDQNAAKNAFENITNGLKTNDFEKLINTFLKTYKSNLTKELLKNCEKFEIKDDNGTPVGIAYNIEKLNDDTEHDNLQIRRLQNLAAPTWCTCHASNCKNYLSNANSFLFIPNEGDRILRIQGHVNGDNISINSVTSLENEHNDNAGCWISEQDDLTHLWAFISTMEQNGYNIKAKNSIFNMEEIASLEEKNRIENRFPSVASLSNKIKNANDINEIMQILNNSEYINIQNGSLKIRNCSTEERNNLIEALYSTSFFSELNINRIPYPIRFKNQEQINLNTITDHSRTMTLTNVHYFNCLNLKELKGNIQQTSTSNIPIVVNVPNLTNAKSIWLSNIENINLQNLIECDSLTLGNQDPITKNTPTLPDITLEKLEKVNEEFSVLNPQKLNLPSIKYINNFKIEIDKEDNFNNFDFIAPNLERIDNLEIRVGYNQNVQEIVKKLSSIIKLAKNTTVIIQGYKTYNQEQIAELAKKAEVE